MIGSEPTSGSSNGRGELTGTERAVAGLRAGILAGRYVSGQRLVEVDLTRELGVGRNSLREAFARLSSDGLVVIEPHRGASIRQLTREEVTHLYEMSELLEGLAARRAAERIDTPGHRERLERAAADIRLTFESESSWRIRRASPFHQHILDLADSTRLDMVVNRMHIQAFAFQRQHDNLPRSEALTELAAAEHRAVAEAVGHGDPAGAETLMREHLRRLHERFLAHATP